MRNNFIQWNPSRFAVRAALCVAVAAACALPAAADQWNKLTKVTFSGPVEVPGKVLPAGTYVFKLMDSASDRDIVQIYNQDQTQLDDTIMAIPDYRMKTPGKTIIRFEERASNSPEALKAWFYPGDNYGVQFVYPHDQAVKIAKRTNQNVLSTGNEQASNMISPVKSKNDRAVQEMKNAKVTGVNPAGQEIDEFIIVELPPQHE